MRGFVAQAVSLAKQRAIGIMTKMADADAWMYLVDHHKIDACLTDEVLKEAQDERPREIIIREGLNAACRAMRRSIEMAHEIIDFDDQLYMPLYARARIRQYDWLVVDEAQDTNPIRRLLYRAMVKRNGRILFIGDDRQAIYGFTGADNDALEIIRRDFACTVFPLTVSFRCPVSVIAEAQRYVPDIEAAPGAKAGRVRRMRERDFGGESLRPGLDAVVCRNTKPLVDLFYSLLKRGIPAYVEGKDEAKSLARLAFRWKRIESLAALAERLVEFRETETTALITKGRGAAAEALSDRIDTLIAVIEGMDPAATMADLKDRLETMFIDSEGRRIPAVALMTAHRSKGREFDRVFIWGANVLMPSRRAESEWEVKQEQNLIYVAITRATDELVWVDIERSQKAQQARHGQFLPVTFAEGHAIAA
jgi:superfamily I DNA/RNA helicase